MVSPAGSPVPAAIAIATEVAKHSEFPNPIGPHPHETPAADEPFGVYTFACPTLHLTGPRIGPPTLDDLIALAKQLTGRDPTPREIERADGRRA